ncbi:hypothetical protein KVR01_011895 [Diaporthe batatas]|uniref:uncharacterized protein n=1 Tax=Diaporthe batatas TaxID=748121 RepID=UPI001D03C256|nr:uncharacterized protein KVR01_011895 [Diaporthe batatas]KAG8158134.1 hypothetical protein KVR01_011895 [Diaporthe batatas]
MDHQSNSLPTGAANTNTNTTIANHPNGANWAQQNAQPQPLPPVALAAYDRYGVLDPVKVDLMVRGIFITREYAAALPHRITPDGRPEPSGLYGTHHSRAPRAAGSSPLPPPGRRRPAARPAAGVGRAQAVRDEEASGAVVGSAGVGRRRSVSAGVGGVDGGEGPSDHEKWAEDEVEYIVRMRAQRVGFRQIAARFPNKNQKAVQEKFYKSLKDPRTPHWNQLYQQLRASHDRAEAQAQAEAEALANAANNDNSGSGVGTHSDPIEVDSDEDEGGGTAGQPIEISSGSSSGDAKDARTPLV